MLHAETIESYLEAAGNGDVAFLAEAHAQGETFEHSHLLEHAALNGRTEVMAYLLDHHLQQDRIITALSKAARFGQLEACQLLVERGADLNQWNSLQDAAKYGHADVVRYFMSKNDYTLRFHSLALETATKYDRKEIAALLAWDRVKCSLNRDDLAEWKDAYPEHFKMRETFQAMLNATLKLPWEMRISSLVSSKGEAQECLKCFVACGLLPDFFSPEHWIGHEKAALTTLRGIRAALPQYAAEIDAIDATAFLTPDLPSLGFAVLVRSELPESRKR